MGVGLAGGGGATAATHSPLGDGPAALPCIASSKPADIDSALFQLVGVAAGHTPIMQPAPSAGGFAVHAPRSWPDHCRHAPPVPAQAPAGFTSA